MSLIDSLYSGILCLLQYFAVLCASVETIVLQILQRPRMTAFRMFPPEELSPVLPREVHLVSALCLLIIPHLVYWERRPVAYTGSGPVGSMIQPWTRANLFVAYACMLARMWLAVAAWNSIVLQFSIDGRLTVAGLKGGMLSFLL
ncbi:hypothetical protein HD806DRAFT_54102 [Xylariaceae sp. AK1471]|nr:hypothetical protein HD806DRAFT_54102 [Xylariaceae sp. AK1471]